jgi:two-component sensor histidine kinase
LRRREVAVRLTLGGTIVETLDFSAAEAPPLPRLHLVEELNHRVINEYTEAILSLSIAAGRANGIRTRSAFDRAINRLQAHVRTHRALMPPTNADVVNLGEYLETLFASMSMATLEENGVRILLKTEDVLLGAEVCWRLGLIFAELVRNAARHGLSRRAGLITVRVGQRAGELNCLVSDDGGAVHSPTPGRGQRLIRSIAAEIGALVDGRFTPNGSRVRVRIPASVGHWPTAAIMREAVPARSSYAGRRNFAPA